VNPYAPHTPAEIAAMLRAIGVESLDDLVAQVPAGLRERAGIELPPGLTEPELRDRFAALADRNAGDGVAVFLGAGAYPHHASAVVNQILLRSEFATAYTPYQPEVSQGTLQAIFEFQTFTALLLGLAVANASMYDGASATAEAVLMARRLLPQRRRALVARALHPHYRAVIQTYLRGLAGVEVREIPFGENGRTDLGAMHDMLDGETLCVVLGQPNVFGVVEDLAAAAPLVRAAGALLVSATTEAVALGLLRSPGACGVDIAVAEGQSFGLPVSYGGPGVGLFAAREQHVRAMPGRIVGETVDGAGRRGYVLTLATREQHIRRERATSNICTNQGLCALAVTVHLAMLGRSGLDHLARVNYRAAHDAARQLEAAGVAQRFAAPFFNEFVVRVSDAEARWEALAKRDGVVAGYPLGRWYPELADALLVCVTETHRRPQIDRLVAALAGGPRARRAGVG
jgi:glycine cleavage system P protein (glycine dehydrogenase) subunit 1